MRVTTDLFVAALLRRVHGSGGFGAVLQRGAAEAGSLFVLCRGRAGELILFVPASQSSYDSARPDDRMFAAMTAADEAAIEAKLARERRFDADLWVVEIEPGSVPVGDLLAITTP